MTVTPQGRPPDPPIPTEAMLSEGKRLVDIPESPTRMDVEGVVVQSGTPTPIVSTQPGKETTEIFPSLGNTTARPLISYATAATSNSSPQQPPKPRWILVGEHDLVPGTFNGEPELRVSDSLRNKLSAPWQRTLVVRLLGRSIGYSILCSRLKALWKPTSEMEIFALDDDCFLVKLGNDKDYFSALSDGPWVIFDHYLVVQQWTPSFRVTDKLPNTMVLCVQFPGLPVHFYHQELLFALGNMIGRAIKLDYHTQHQQRAKFSRMAVEVDLSKPLVPRIRLDGRWQKVEFENIPVVCFECGKVGHTKITCPLICQNRSDAEGQGRLPSPISDAGVEVSGDVAGFGPWMLVTRKSRRNQREGTGHGNSDLKSPAYNGHKAGNSGKGDEDGKESLENPPKMQNGKLGKAVGSSAGKKEDVKKGKAPIVNSVETTEKGVLGPRPNAGDQASRSTKPKNDLEASTSATEGPQKGRSNKWVASKTHDGPSSVSSPSGSAQNAQGESETRIRIVETMPYPSPPPRIVDPAAPSANILTKHKKGKKKGMGSDRSVTPHGTPIRHNPSKALQVWSPVKEKKVKSRERRVSLTLQQIQEWTNAVIPRDEAGRTAAVLSNMAIQGDGSDKAAAGTATASDLC
ncbi:unnamed protein product [Linum trigynum]|uniref:CCHC-type domain-containing protein n=1 Tax=Linum trigynum TaxID=586398 RepID=A0AAV2FKL8_9ROSI